jgi:large subunit ribosomal protein L21
MYAVIKTGGKQYRVAANDQILIEKLEGETGDQVHFTDVLMVANGGSVDVGAPLVAGVTVVGEIAKQVKSDTVYIFKKRRRKHYRRRNGHRQLLTSVTITEILTGGAKPAAKAKSEKSAKTSATATTSEKSGSTKSTKADAGVQAGSDAGSKSAADANAKAGSAKSAGSAGGAGGAAAGKATQAATLKSAGAASGKEDDISLIAGIGPKMVEILHKHDVKTFAQIANWTASDLEKFDELCKPKGRIAREEWVEQAKELMAGKAPRAKADRERE